MPYENERANPLGLESLKQNLSAIGRINRWTMDQEVEEGEGELLDTRTMDSLQGGPTFRLEDLGEVTTVDGSVVVASEKLPVAALKIAVVRQDLQKYGELLERPHGRPVSTKDYNACYSTTTYSAILPSEAFSQPPEHLAYKVELLELLKSWRTPQGKLLASFLRSDLGLSNDEIKEDVIAPLTYFSEDHTGAMVLLEKLLAAATAFESRGLHISDGPFYLHQHPKLSRRILEKYRKFSHDTAIVGVVKTGSLVTLFSRGGEREGALAPGEILMVTSGFQGRTLKQSRLPMAKHFVYQSPTSGLIVFTMLPSQGQVEEDKWGNYPHLPTVLSYIDLDRSDRFKNSLEIIARANFETSLPKVETQRWLRSLLLKSRHQVDFNSAE